MSTGSVGWSRRLPEARRRVSSSSPTTASRWRAWTACSASPWPSAAFPSSSRSTCRRRSSCAKRLRPCSKVASHTRERRPPARDRGSNDEDRSATVMLDSHITNRLCIDIALKFIKLTADNDEKRVAEKQISFAADRRENQGARRLARQDAEPAP